jgi:hypothetical protein
MKYLKLTLADGKNYTFTTFSVLEQRIMKKEYEKYRDMQEEDNKIQFELDDKGDFKKDEQGKWIPKSKLTDKEKLKVQDIENLTFEFMFDIFRKSICKSHKEFVKTGDANKDSNISDQMQSLVDMSDLRKITEFAFNGTYFKEETSIDASFVLEIKEVVDGTKQ